MSTSLKGKAVSICGGLGWFIILLGLQCIQVSLCILFNICPCGLEENVAVWLLLVDASISLEAVNFMLQDFEFLYRIFVLGGKGESLCFHVWIGAGIS